MQLKVIPPLVPDFRPLEMELRAYEKDVAASTNTVEIAVQLTRNEGYCDYFTMRVFKDHADQRTVPLADRFIQTFLWVRGGYKIRVYGSEEIYQYLKTAYAAGGMHAYDAEFMADVYERPFEVVQAASMEEVTVRKTSERHAGRHLKGCRIGFDAGGSDRKVSAVIDGETVYSEEVVWFPKLQSDPMYHCSEVRKAMKSAAEHLPRVDAIGVSSAGVYIHNKAMKAGLFQKIPKDQFEKYIKNIYIDIGKEMGVPLEVSGDGDVTALAGSMNLNVGKLLGIAIGTGEASGYVDGNMNLTGWLNELSYAPIIYVERAETDTARDDRASGGSFFCQAEVIRLAEKAGIKMDETLSPAEKLKVVQAEMEKGNPAVPDVYKSIGVLFGYSLAWYSRFYDFEHVVIMGRVTSGQGGTMLLEKTQQVLDEEFPELAKKVTLHIPDEKSRRVGQSVAAASLPDIG